VGLINWIESTVPSAAHLPLQDFDSKHCNLINYKESESTNLGTLLIPPGGAILRVIARFVRLARSGVRITRTHDRIHSLPLTVILGENDNLFCTKRRISDLSPRWECRMHKSA
jgi:hypothetical protein